MSEVYKGSWGGSPQVTNYPSKTTNMFMTWTWLICGVLVLIVPSIQRAMKMRNYQKMYRMYNWEESQQQYQQEQQEYYQNYQQQQNQGQGDYNYNNYSDQQQMKSSYDVNNCQWYQLNCFSYYIDADGEPQPEDGWVRVFLVFFCDNGRCCVDSVFECIVLLLFISPVYLSVFLLTIYTPIFFSFLFYSILFYSILYVYMYIYIYI